MSEPESVINIGQTKQGALWVPAVLELGQFWRYLGNTYCFRPTCDGCRFSPTCDRESLYTKVGSGLNIRRAFRAKPGFKLVSIDYKGIELRVAAQLSGEPIWKRAFKEGADLHNEMAKVAFKTANPTKDQRGQAKCANFGNLFLGNASTLARQSSLSLAEAVYVWNAWWDTVLTYKRWTDNQLKVAQTSRKVKTYFGRTRQLGGLLDQAARLESQGKGKESKQRMGFIHRTSVNSPVQGTAADIMKIAMCQVVSMIEKNAWQDDVKLLLTVHDELVFEIRDDQDFCHKTQTVANTMIPDFSSYGWDVPIEVDIEVGDNWAEIVDFSKIKQDRGYTDKNSGKPALVADKETPPEDLIIVLNTRLNKDNQNALTLALYRAKEEARKPGSIGVPVKVQVAGETYRSGTLGKVHEGTLRRALAPIQGVEVVDRSDKRWAKS